MSVGVNRADKGHGNAMPYEIRAWEHAWDGVAWENGGQLKVAATKTSNQSDSMA